MLRRTHKKSRKGCHECKRRHIKCDETRPVCKNCTVAERVCHYGSKSDLATDDSPSPKTSNHSSPPRVVLQPDAAYLSPDLNVSPDETTEAASDVNLKHMELLIHYSLTISVPELDLDVDEAGTRLVLNKTHNAPWLLHEILAISARHLAVTNPENSAFHLTQSMHLQTKAIELFNSANLHIDESNCEAAVLFSSTLGRHVLVDTPANHDIDADLFLRNYIRYVQIHRGLRTIAESCWPFIIESDMKPIVARTSGLSQKPLRGNELDPLRELVSRSPDLDQDSSSACLQAIHYLQLGLDQFTEPESQSRLSQYQMVFIWSVMTPPTFIKLVKQHQPEALVILGHYAVLLHHARNLWQIGRAGAFLLQVVSKLLLDTEWIKHLSWAQIIIG